MLALTPCLPLGREGDRGLTAVEGETLIFFTPVRINIMPAHPFGRAGVINI